MKPHERPPRPLRGMEFVPVEELGIPQRFLEIRRNTLVTNHHLWWTARAMGRLTITQSLRDLDPYQRQMNHLGHDWEHDHFGPPIQPHLSIIMGRLALALDQGEMLRYGTAHEYRLEPMNEQIWQACEQEYNQLHQIDRIEV